MSNFGSRPVPLQAEDAKLSSQSTYGKLTVLLLHFPALRWLWSPSPRTTARYFLRLKEGCEQPRADDHEAAARSLGMGGSGSGLNVSARDALRKVCGVTPANLPTLVGKARSLYELAALSEADITEAIGPTAKSLYDFLHFDAKEQT